ncbi:hypothetical protein AX14_013795 [Amanita brunnescens Koide BX004]|nr:hypothetical protein AX14_013795 [Amanita brunnescens Koide BX004]
MHVVIQARYLWEKTAFTLTTSKYNSTSDRVQHYRVLVGQPLDLFERVLIEISKFGHLKQEAAMPGSDVVSAFELNVCAMAETVRMMTNRGQHSESRAFYSDVFHAKPIDYNQFELLSRVNDPWTLSRRQMFSSHLMPVTSMED